MTCPFCSSADTAVRRRDVEDLEYFVVPARPFVERRCRSCGSEFLDPRPTLAELDGFYPDDYHAYNEDHGLVARALVGVRARGRQRLYEELVGSRAGRIFDVGAGDCRHFDELRRRCDFEFAGVELKPEVAAKARERGYDVAAGTLEEMDLSGHVGRYDIVSMNHVLEHVVDPQLVVKRSFELLRPGGWLIGQLPTVDSWEAKLFGRRWGGYHFPRHLQVPSHAGMDRLLGAAGFAEVTMRSAPHIQTAISLQNTLIGRGWRPRMSHGKTPVYSLLLLAVLPFEALAWLADRGGIADFRARKPG